MAVTVGEKATPLVAVPFDAVQVYVLAPLPFTLTVLPKHIDELVDDAETVGKALTVTVIAAILVLVHPAVLVPVTE